MTTIGHTILRRFGGAFRTARGPALALLLTGSVAGCTAAIWMMLAAARQNAIIAQFADGKDVPVDPATAPAPLLMARQHFLITHDQLEEAQIFADIATPRAPPHMSAQILYNLGNARVRQAFALIEKADLDKATSVIGLAKANYRAALRIEPQDWDIKHNLDVAQRLVRDLPREGIAEDDEPPPTKKAKPLWTDLPGMPRGLP